MKISRIISIWLLLVMLVITNLHLPVLQVGAWAGMLVEYSRGNTFIDAMEMTFDGDHPCEMCKVIKAEQTKSDTDHLQAETQNRLLLFIEPILAWTHELHLLEILDSFPASLSQLTHQPETPPPRSAV